MSELYPEINSENPTPPKKRSKTGLKIGLLVAMAALIISPLDIVPDLFGPVGWLDDLAYLIGIVITVRNMITGRNKEKK